MTSAINTSYWIETLLHCVNVFGTRGVSQVDTDNSLAGMYASHELRANNFLVRLQLQW